MKQQTASPGWGRYIHRTGRLIRFLIATLLVVSSTGVGAQETSLDLEEFLALVEAESLRLEQFRTDRDLAAVQEDLARSQIFPFVGGEVGYTRNVLDIEQDFAVAADSNQEIGGTGSGVFPLIAEPIDVNSDNDYSFGVSIQQRLFDATVFRAIEASEQFTTLTGTVYEASRQSILTGAKRLFFQTLLLQEVLAVRRSSEEIARENFVDTQRRLDNGLASPLEVLQAEVNWRITQPETSQAQRNLNVALQNLKNFAGLSQTDAVVLEGTLNEYPAPPSFETAFDERADRPDYQALLSERRLREINVAAQRAQFYPTLSAQFAYGWQASDDG
ncbi:MAG: TolC family protein, partial [Spirochaetales bacterium]|nr:TolC family protein [Spirochaetales bacterium]